MESVSVSQKGKRKGAAVRRGERERKDANLAEGGDVDAVVVTNPAEVNRLHPRVLCRASSAAAYALTGVQSVLTEAKKV